MNPTPAQQDVAVATSEASQAHHLWPLTPPNRTRTLHECSVLGRGWDFVRERERHTARLEPGAPCLGAYRYPRSPRVLAVVQRDR